MSYLDDYEEYDARFDHSIYRDIREEIPIVYEGISLSEIVKILDPTGLIETINPAYSGDMEKLVFSLGDEREVYSPIEIKYIERNPLIYVFEAISRPLNNGSIPCRVIVTSLPGNSNNAVIECLAFEKIVNKALEGFNTFLIVLDDSLILGCKLFSKRGTRDCIISRPIRWQDELDSIVYQFIELADPSFPTFYNNTIDAIKFFDSSIGYEEDIIRRRGVQSRYLDFIASVEQELGLDFSGERNRYLQYFQQYEDSYIKQINEAEESLSGVKSNKINTYELLFDAEEMMKMAIEVEKKNEILSSTPIVMSYSDNESDEEAIRLLSDSEAIIKLLKERRGM